MKGDISSLDLRCDLADRDLKIHVPDNPWGATNIPNGGEKQINTHNM